ncbi:MAG: polysaccharide biosynthesis protein, partial [Mollicutes bacterium]|nr:polysaccharide biosynthesis protein [Mollicutes bacterium]
AWATVFDIGVAAILNMYFVRKYTNFTIDLVSLSKSIVAASIMGICIFGVYQAVLQAAQSNGIAAASAVFIGSVVYVFVLVLIGGIDERDIQRIPVIGTKLGQFIRMIGLIKNRD